MRNLQQICLNRKTDILKVGKREKSSLKTPEDTNMQESQKSLHQSSICNLHCFVKDDAAKQLTVQLNVSWFSFPTNQQQ